MDRDNNRGMRDWLIFIRTAETGSVAGAARQLGMTPAAVSKAVSRFEHYLDVMLFTRTPRGMLLTDAGQTTLVRAREIAASFHALLEDIRSHDDEVRGSVRLAAPAIVCEYLAGHWLNDFSLRYPEVKIFLDAREKDDLSRDSPELDELVLRSGQIESEDLVHRRLSPVKLLLCASPSYIVSHGPVSHPRELSGHRLFGMHHNGLAEALMLSRAGESFSVEKSDGGGVSSNNVLAMLNLVLAGKGISLAVPGWLAAGYIARGELVQVLPDWSIPDLPVWLIWRQRPRQTKLFTLFREYIAKQWSEGSRTESGQP